MTFMEYDSNYATNQPTNKSYEQICERRDYTFAFIINLNIKSINWKMKKTVGDYNCIDTLERQ